MQSNDPIVLSRPTLEDMLERASEVGARRALREVGLHDEDAMKDILELRSVLDSFRSVKRVVLKTVVTWITTGILALVALGAAAKNWFGN